MIFEYNYEYEGYMPKNSDKTLEEALDVEYIIEYIRLCVEFNVSTYIPAKLSGAPENCYEAEGGELTLESIYPMYLTTVGSNIPIKLTKQMRIIIGDYIEEDIVEKECWKIWEKDQL